MCGIALGVAGLKLEGTRVMEAIVVMVVQTIKAPLIAVWDCPRESDGADVEAVLDRQHWSFTGEEAANERLVKPDFRGRRRLQFWRKHRLPC